MHYWCIAVNTADFVLLPKIPIQSYFHPLFAFFQVLKGISIVDTPGILSGEKQRTDRGYDFIGKEILESFLFCMYLGSFTLSIAKWVQLNGKTLQVLKKSLFIGVLEWFAERVDRILLLFDAHKLDISDEFKRSIEALRNHDDKIRFVISFITF